ncbi:winged helix-turn-helix domain-containing protein [Haloarcula amylovorans]|uniref:winged helix-turn-helix domain-containing protein n=1 Tax=Haloarcula amylovorans TaxID=2562280 RepID=UPI0010760BE0|nr:winged helix-turn-helix domain-containing protein [Halomicroarcula amylolytica]
MAAETAHTTPDPDEGELEQYVDQRLFDDSMGTLADHAARKAALGDQRRYAILFLLWEREEVARKELAAAIDDDSYDLSHHLGELVDVGLVARTGAPADADGRQTFYTITHLGHQEIEADTRNITGAASSQ